MREELLSPVGRSGRGGRGDDAAAAAPRRVRRPAAPEGAPRDHARRGARSAARRSTTCSSRARPGSARRRWPASSPPRWASRLRITSGPALERAGDLAAILTNLDDGDVLFIDEIHRLPRAGRRGALSRRWRTSSSTSSSARARRRARSASTCPRFTLVGATTRTGLITGPLRDRFGFVARLDYYDADDLVAILERAARILGVPLEPDGAAEIAGRARGTPRIANRLLKRVRDYAEVRADGTVDRRRPPAPRSRCSRSTSSASTRSTAPILDRAVRDVRRAAGRARHARGRGGRGAGDRRGRLRAVPPQGRAAPAHAAGPGRDAGRVRPPRAAPPPAEAPPPNLFDGEGPQARHAVAPALTRIPLGHRHYLRGRFASEPRYRHCRCQDTMEVALVYFALLARRSSS